MEPNLNFYVAGVKFHDLDTVIDEIEEGDELILVPDSTNEYDKNAVEIYYSNGDVETMLGFVPKALSASVSAAIENEEIFDSMITCTVLKVNKNEKPWKQLRVLITEEEV